MNDDEYRELLRVVERPAPVSEEFTDRVFRSMLEELESEGRVVESMVGARQRRMPRLRPTLAIAAVVLLVVLVASLLVETKNAPSALAALQEARARYRALPAYHAVTAVRANENNDDPDFETQWETEDWYRSADNWRTTIRSSNAAFIGQPGDYQVLGGGLYGEYRAEANVFTATPVDERQGGAPSSPALFFDPSLQWWSTGEPGEPGRPSDRFFEENCSATDATYIGRATTKLHCPAKPRDIDLVLDKVTGMLLRVSVFDVNRQVTRIEFEPDFPTGILDVEPPEGAKRRWGGQGTPPPDYQVAIGTDVAARYQVTEPAGQGLSVGAVARDGVWLTVIRCDQTGCHHQLRRINPKNGEVVAVIDPPNDEFVNDVALLGDDIWVSLSERLDGGRSIGRTFVQRVDRASNALAGPRIETGEEGGQLVGVGDELWSTGGVGRDVRVGPAQTRYSSVARVNPATGAVTQIELDGGAGGSPAFAGGKVWVATSKINQRDPYQTDYAIVAIDPATNAVVQRITTPGPIDAITFLGDRLHVLFPTIDGGRMRWFIGIADTAAPAPTLSTKEIAPAGSELGPSAFAGDVLWVTSFLQDAVLKIDPTTLEVTGTVATGRGPSGLGEGLGSVWVTNVQDGTLVRIDVE